MKIEILVALYIYLLYTGFFTVTPHLLISLLVGSLLHPILPIIIPIILYIYIMHQLYNCFNNTILHPFEQNSEYNVRNHSLKRDEITRIFQYR